VSRTRSRREQSSGFGTSSSDDGAMPAGGDRPPPRRQRRRQPQHQSNSGSDDDDDNNNNLRERPSKRTWRLSSRVMRRQSNRHGNSSSNNHDDDLRMKLLLIGKRAHGTAKQLRLEWGSPMDDDELRMYGALVRANVVEDARRLCSHLRSSGLHELLVPEQQQTTGMSVSDKQELISHVSPAIWARIESSGVKFERLVGMDRCNSTSADKKGSSKNRGGSSGEAPVKSVLIPGTTSSASTAGTKISSAKEAYCELLSLLWVNNSDGDGCGGGDCEQRQLVNDGPQDECKDINNNTSSGSDDPDINPAAEDGDDDDDEEEEKREVMPSSGFSAASSACNSSNGGDWIGAVKGLSSTANRDAKLFLKCWQSIQVLCKVRISLFFPVLPPFTAERSAPGLGASPRAMRPSP